MPPLNFSEQATPRGFNPLVQTYELMDVYLKELLILQSGFTTHIATLAKEHKHKGIDSFLIDQIRNQVEFFHKSTADFSKCLTAPSETANRKSDGPNVGLSLWENHANRLRHDETFQSLIGGISYHLLDALFSEDKPGTDSQITSEQNPTSLQDNHNFAPMSSPIQSFIPITCVVD